MMSHRKSIFHYIVSDQKLDLLSWWLNGVIWLESLVYSHIYFCINIAACEPWWWRAHLAGELQCTVCPSVAVRCEKLFAQLMSFAAPPGKTFFVICFYLCSCQVFVILLGQPYCSGEISSMFQFYQRSTVK